MPPRVRSGCQSPDKSGILAPPCCARTVRESVTAVAAIANAIADVTNIFRMWLFNFLLCTFYFAGGAGAPGIG